MKIRAQLRCMASSEIMQMIPADKLQEIKLKDSAPMFKAFVVGHEGEARGNLIGVGNIIKRWFRSAIEKLHEKISAGLQLFHGHAATNETTGREPIGEVVGKKILNIHDRLSSVVACYIYPYFRKLPLDVASIEADVDLQEDARAGLYVADVKALTGIALGNSAIETPGFPGATLLGQLQAFANHKNLKGDFMDITIEDVKAFIKAESSKPSDLFGAESLAEDPAVKGLIETETRQARAGEYAHRKRTEEGFDKTRQEWEDKLKVKDGELLKLRKDAAKAQVGSLFEKQKAERKLDEKQSKFIQTRLAKFEPIKIEDLEKEFNLHLDGEIEEYKRIAKDVFGVEEKPAGDGGKGGDGGTGPADKSKESPDNKYLDPERNPMIKIAGDI
jgi:hypothetical protein